MAQWKRGESGNLAGRPVKIPPIKPRHAASVAQQLIDSECTILVQTAIQMARGGDSVALKICMDRLVPPRKSAPLLFELPFVDDDARLPEAVMKAVIKNIGNGVMTPNEAHDIVGLLKTYMEAREHSQLVDEIERLRAEVELLRDGVRSAPKPAESKSESEDVEEKPALRRRGPKPKEEAAGPERPLTWDEL